MKTKTIFLGAIFFALVVLISCGGSSIKSGGSSIKLEPVLIPGGTFTMGSPTSEEEHDKWKEVEHQVTLSAFRISKYEITNAQYADFLNAKSVSSNGKYAAGAYPTEALIYPDGAGSLYDWGLHYTDSQWIPVAGCENHPAINVTWYGASEFASYAGGTLPTEAQWEYACRGNTTTAFNTGDCLSEAQANFNSNCKYNDCPNTTSCPGKTQAVGTYPANAFGLHDMHGNVAEWCSDLNGDYSTSPQTNPTGALTAGAPRVYRGGSWKSTPGQCRSAIRNSASPRSREFFIGFRVAFPK